MNFFAKNGLWIATILSTASTIFGQSPRCAPSQKSFEQGHEMMMSHLVAGYSAPARIDVRGSWDIYTVGSFTYWQPIQENMELGIVSNQTDPVYAIDGKIVNLNFNYKPGFQAGLGINFDHDNWDSVVKYTWFRGSHRTTTTLDSTAFPNTILFPTWINPDSRIVGFYEGTQKWTLHMDIIDWELARSYYVGTKLTFRPFFSARALWIRQNIDVAYSNQSTYNGADAGSNVNIQKKSHSWAIGPRAGLYSQWMLGDGFRLFGNGGGDILFTQYKKLKSNQQFVHADGTLYPLGSYRTEQTKLNCLKGHLDLELGLGWGTYFDNNNWHIDLSAGYGFQIFFDQNMFRHFNDVQSLAVSNSPNGNLYVHGLTAEARFDF